LFACDECTARLNALARLSEGVRRITREGNVSAILPAPFVRRLRDVGLRVREYRLQAGGSVACTIAPEDDLVLAHLHAPLQDVERLDVVFHDVSANSRTRVEDVAFDPTAGEVVLLPNATHLRQVVSMTLQVQLLAADSARDRIVGEYTFNHSNQG
jgi:hypothetical protein